MAKADVKIGNGGGDDAHVEVSVKVAKGASLDHGGKSYGAGDSLKLPIHNAQQLAASGTVEVV